MRRLLIGIAWIGSVLAAGAPTDNYVQKIKAWQQHRVDGLRKPDSWLTLVGLFWLKPGPNTIGSDPSNRVVLPKNAPAKLGTLTLAGSTVTYTPVGQASRPLSYGEEKPDVVTAGSVSFYVLQRGDRFGIRAKDSASPVLKNFTGSDFFPINPAFHFQAKLIPDPKQIPILNVLGQTEQQESPGLVEFAYQGHNYRLRPIYEGKGDKKTLFFLFKDATNRLNTYQAGRMLNTPLPGNGVVDLDFNRSYNPPCTYTPYATCPLPPKQNALPFAVEAGEKRYGNGHADYSAMGSLAPSITKETPN